MVTLEEILVSMLRLEIARARLQCSTGALQTHEREQRLLEEASRAETVCNRAGQS